MAFYPEELGHNYILRMKIQGLSCDVKIGGCLPTTPVNSLICDTPVSGKTKNQY